MVEPIAAKELEPTGTYPVYLGLSGFIWVYLGLSGLGWLVCETRGFQPLRMVSA